MTEDNKEILTRFIEAVWNQGDTAAVDDYLAERYTIHHDPGDPWHGQTLTVAGYKQRLQQSRAPFPDQRFETRHLLAEGDIVSMAWTWQATHLGDMPGFPASGKPIRMSGVTLYFFEGGRISGHWQVTDRLGVYQQMLANQKKEG